MAGINKVILVGRLGKDPDVKYTNEGKAIANVTLATEESWKDKITGQKQKKTEWHRIVFFNGIADVVAEYLHKGAQIYIEGKLQTRKWQDQNGQDRYTTEVAVDGFSGVMQMLDSRLKEIYTDNHPTASIAPIEQTGSTFFDNIPSTPFEDNDMDNQIPF